LLAQLLDVDEPAHLPDVSLWFRVLGRRFDVPMTMRAQSSPAA
jgi:hypothetical protein